VELFTRGVRESVRSAQESRDMFKNPARQSLFC
jgi:hypothetical protein